MADSIEESLDEILEFSFKLNNENQIALLFEIIEKIHVSLSKKAMSRLFGCIERHKYFNDIVVRILLMEHDKGLKLPFIPLTLSFSEDTLIELLQVDSNLT